MVHRMPVSDFRAVRCILDADDFAVKGEDDTQPTDLVPNDSWHGIVDLPDDVAIRTSSHNGRKLHLLYELWGDWITSVGDVDNQDELYGCMLDATDCFQSATFDLLHGYYRSALSNLRAALELVMIGSYGNLRPGDSDYVEWKEGETDRFGFTKCRRRTHEVLSGHPAQWMLDNTSFPAATFQDLCGFTHSRPNSTDGALWSSNGPIYTSEGFTLAFRMSLRIYAICYLLVRIARPCSVLPDSSKLLFGFDWLENGTYAAKAFMNLYPEESRALSHWRSRRFVRVPFGFSRWLCFLQLAARAFVQPGGHFTLVPSHSTVGSWLRWCSPKKSNQPGLSCARMGEPTYRRTGSSLTPHGQRDELRVRAGLYVCPALVASVRFQIPAHTHLSARKRVVREHAVSVKNEHGERIFRIRTTNERPNVGNERLGPRLHLKVVVHDDLVAIRRNGAVRWRTQSRLHFGNRGLALLELGYRLLIHLHAACHTAGKRDGGCHREDSVIHDVSPSRHAALHRVPETVPQVRQPRKAGSVP